MVVDEADDTDSDVSAHGGSASLPPSDGKAEGEPEQGEPKSVAEPECGDLPVTPEPQAEVTAHEDLTPAVGCTPEANGSDEAKETQQLRLVPAIVPKFYGYYKSVDEEFASMSDTHPHCDRDSECDVSWPTRILLLEECGTTVDPSLFTRDQRHVCFEVLQHLHLAGFMQGSAYVRNFLVQPGPLTVPRAQRTMEKPSFRIIDFGRGEAAQGLSWSCYRGFERFHEGDLERAARELHL
ncbi:uncharacterized protein TRAVEDRAFT_133289 [Trametes versicolor FP-101664 SS1]|uniref:uncharacterized protein n=1 Tax=Trametes versicolor (strain FP-101664) TaxID=717944 RepID=UPI0004623DD3|nr:uncharacterized protein TRAVEDRAFT_133289 [Trametes versicolor FP-101664 SS1]EIW53253.1 hypothetical protein TRAVEDRAFT_133289 [Trametes versicolor FP-101664 SS1]